MKTSDIEIVTHRPEFPNRHNVGSRGRFPTPLWQIVLEMHRLLPPPPTHPANGLTNATDSRRNPKRVIVNYDTKTLIHQNPK